MILCPNCGIENGDLTVICKNCGGFLQGRIPTLDLFSTMWQIIDAPARGMKRVALAVHKNYVLLLSSLYGIGLAFFLMWYLALGERFDNIMFLSFAGLLVGPLIGIVHLCLAGIIGALVARIFGKQLRFIDVLAVVAYATLPIILGLVFILPIEIMTFGIYLFSHNPSPMVIRPVSYIVLMILDSLTILWSMVLFVIGIRTLGIAKIWRSALIVLLTVGFSLLGLLQVLRAVV